MNMTDQMIQLRDEKMTEMISAFIEAGLSKDYVKKTVTDNFLSLTDEEFENYFLAASK